jgi:hypothetical protein
MQSEVFGTYLFPRAAELWLKEKRHHVSPAMALDYEKCIRALTKFFAVLRLNEITIGHVRTYQKSRAVRVGASRINRDIVTLGQIMRQAGLWEPIKRFYRPFPCLNHPASPSNRTKRLTSSAWRVPTRAGWWRSAVRW